MKKRILATCAAIIMAVAMFPSTAVYAWDKNTEDTDPGNVQTVEPDGTEDETVKYKTGSIGINGSIKKFNPDVEPDPEDPDRKDDVVWINVTIPKNMYFASTDVDKGKIVGSQHRVINNSPYSVKISTDDLVIGQDHITDTGYKLTLKVLDMNNDNNNLEVSGNCNIINNAVKLIEDGNSAVTKGYHFATLFDGVSESDGTNIVGKAPSYKKGAIIMQLSGELPSGYDYATSAAKNPKYTLVLQFATGDNLRKA